MHIARVLKKGSINKIIHLDFGCGTNPRNPFKCEILVTCDLYKYNENFPSDVISPGDELPYECEFFDSISAYDVLEHLSRDGTTNQFIYYMNELYRVLKIGGYAIFIFPDIHSKEVYSDPTHVNFIHKRTIDYFKSNESDKNYANIITNYEVLINKKIRRWSKYYPNENRKFEFGSFRRKASLLKRDTLRFIFPTHRIWILRKTK